MQWPYINHIAHTGNVTICRDHEARDRRDIIVIGKVLNIKRLLQGMQICTAFYQPAVTISNDFRRFVSVREFTRNGFQHIQRRDQTLYHTKLVGHDNKAPASTTQHAQQVDRIEGFRDDNRRRRRSNRRHINALFQRHQQFFSTYNTDDFIQFTATYREQTVR
ncbi:Uncharacterised protein [Shigella sonnei]|nr:Uncharacterised protein [Shigella sonnei]